MSDSFSEVSSFSAAGQAGAHIGGGLGNNLDLQDFLEKEKQRAQFNAQV